MNRKGRHRGGLRARVWKFFDRRIAGPTHRQLIYLGALQACIIAAGGLYLAVLHGDHGAFWHAFLYATDSGYMGQDMAVLEGPSFLAVMATLLRWVFMSGLFLTILVNGYQEHVGRIRDGKRRYAFSGGHGIVLGWNRMAVASKDYELSGAARRFGVRRLLRLPFFPARLLSTGHTF